MKIDMFIENILIHLYIYILLDSGYRWDRNTNRSVTAAILYTRWRSTSFSRWC